MKPSLELPKGDSPTLALVHPTEEEQLIQFKLNSTEWSGALSPSAYLLRENILSRQALTKDGGITYWILIDTALKNNPLDPESGTRLPLASCETYRKKALTWRDGKLQDVVSHGVGSVFCGQYLRKRGYAQRMMTELGKALRTYQVDEEKECLFTILYSDIGKVSYEYVLEQDALTTIEILRRFWLEAFSFITRCSASQYFYTSNQPTRFAAFVRRRPTRAMQT